MIVRDIEPRLKLLARQFPAMVLTGPRQSGKSTLCQKVFARLPYATLESPDVRSFALEDAKGFLKQFPKGAILDEIQNCPALCSYLQEMIDQNPVPGRWILTGSHNLSVMQSASQSLAGRAGVLHLLPLNRREVVKFESHPRSLNETLLTGGYPRILDKKTEAIGLAGLLRGNLLGAGRPFAFQHRRFGGLPAFHATMRRTTLPTLEFLIVGRRLWHFSTDGEGLGFGAGGKFYYAATAELSREYIQAFDQDAQAAFL